MVATTGRTCVPGIHEQPDTVVYEVGEQRSTVTHRVACGPEVKIYIWTAASEISRRIYAQLRFDRGVVHERFDPVEFFITGVAPYTALADIVRIQLQF